MKTASFLFLFYLFSYFNVFTQTDTTSFITRWSTVLTKDPATTTITIPVDNKYSFNYDVDWNNDGVFDTLGVTTSISHDYGVGGHQVIRIRGKFPSIKFYNKHQLLSVDQWGIIQWKDMEAAFSNCRLVNFKAKDQPRLDSVKSMGAMFHSAYSFNSNINHWDVSAIEDMSAMFYNTAFYNQPLDKWDVSSVKSMRSMFAYSWKFDQPLNTWRTNALEDITYMFENARVFNQRVSNWDVSSVTRMHGVFKDAKKFNQNLGKWDISSLQYAFKMLDLCGMDQLNYDSTIMGWQRRPHQKNVRLGAFNRRYCLSDSVRSILISEGWSISGDGKSCTLVGMDEVMKQAEFTIYPNPSQSIFNFSINQLVKGERVEIRNVLGELIFTSRPQLGVNRVDLSAQPEGIYFLGYGEVQEKLLLTR
jgi:surface protein